MSRRKTAALCFIKGTMSGCFCNKYPELIFHTPCFSVFKKGIQTAIFPGRWLSMEPQAVSHDATHYFFILVFFLFCFCFYQSSINRVSHGPHPGHICVSTSWLIYLDQAKAQMCLVKRQLRVNHDFKGSSDRSQTEETSERCGIEKSLLHAHAHTSHVPYEVLVGLLGVPLLPLFACLHLRQQRLPVRLVGLDDVFELLHEEQLQHALVRVQVCQLEQLPLQDVVVLEWCTSIHLQPVWNLGCVVWVSWHEDWLVPLCRTWLIGHGRW